MKINTRTDFFEPRHIGPGPDETREMLDTIGVSSLDELIRQTVPDRIRRDRGMNLPGAVSESSFLEKLRKTAARNRVCKTYIGMGYHDCLTPNVILRNILENPGWYTPYTPYQAEIAQGRLEALLNFQTMVSDLTGLPVANASLLDEATAAAEAMMMLYRIQRKKIRKGAIQFLVEPTCWPQVVAVLKSHAEPLGIELVFGSLDDVAPDQCFGMLLQYPNGLGAIQPLGPVIEAAHEADLLVAVAADPMSLVLLESPGEAGADIVLGSSQRFGVPLGYGGPHAAFFATREEYLREMPGRIIGVSIDSDGQPAYRMSLQTREQHIRRDKAKSNICTAQALLASIAGSYAVYHGPGGLKHIASRIHALAVVLADSLKTMGLQQNNEQFFDTLHVELPPGAPEAIRSVAEAEGINFRFIDETHIGISVNETTTSDDLVQIMNVLAGGLCVPPPSLNLQLAGTSRLGRLERTDDILTHEVFRRHHSESRMMRYLKQLERKDVGLDTSMIPLGSCTMKLNAATEMIPVTWPEFCKLHPFVPRSQAEGYTEIFQGLEKALAEITGLDGVSLQPNSGAQGEYAGLMVIRAYHQSRGEDQRNKVLIPSSAHGTNPASAIMSGMDVVVVRCDDDGNIDVADLEAKAEAHADTLAALMVTYPSTHGVFESSIMDICRIVHEHGGQVYMDGANLNAQVGLTSPAAIGADVCHINLHKTFAIPHGGGGPGMGPIAAAEHLVPFLPGHPELEHDDRAVEPVSAAPWGSAGILVISWAYICLLGPEGMTEATKYAILNANYLKARLEPYFNVLYTGQDGRVAHEMIFDLRPFKQASGITETDVAKRLMDYGFHAPTVSWPVPGTMMIEPTESEDKEELDRFCAALISIREEIQEIIDGQADPEDNVLTNAPHTAEQIGRDQWNRPYSREKAAYPLSWLRRNKVWPSVGRIDNTHGDRNLVCSCPPLEAYE